MIRWNVSSRAADLSGGDAIVVSVPKSGRTWVRTFLSAYYARVAGREFVLDPPRDTKHGIPRVIFTHDAFENRTKGSWWDKARGKYLVPARELNSTRIVLLARDPRDTFVSLHAHVTRRDPDAPADVKSKSVHELLHDGRFGIAAIVDAMNGWLNEFGSRGNFLLVHYEALRAAPAPEFRRLLHFIRNAPIEEPALTHALAFSDFENMQRLEAAGAFDSSILRPTDRDDPESYKVRRGKIGGFADYLSAEELEFADAACAKLDMKFGYHS